MSDPGATVLGAEGNLPSATPPRLRRDLQALRGFAVLLVVLYHARVPGFPGGYLGVDVFFVVSGFLITRLVAEGITRGDFRFRDFYLRRARRLLPAALVTILVSALAAPWLLTRPELDDFLAQLVGAVTFSANFVLWRQSGYFAGAAEMKPLLHTWSLAVEEQFYFVLPALLAFTPRSAWRWVVGAGLLGSLALAVVMRESTAVAFYLLPTRAWELLAGSALALAGTAAGVSPATGPPFWTRTVTRWTFLPALATLAVLPTLGLALFHPGPVALGICIATVIVLAHGEERGMDSLLGRSLRWLGDISYSLYLVHWPLFAFYNNAWLAAPEEQPWQARAALVAASVVLAAVLHRTVEAPFRHAGTSPQATPGSRRFVVGAALASVLVVAVGALGRQTFAADPARGAFRAHERGLNASCDYEAPFDPATACRAAASPSWLLWGDSFAMQFEPGLAQGAAPLPFVAATRSRCSPLLAMASLAPDKGYGASWGRDCVDANARILAYVAATPSIEGVVLAGRLSLFVDDGAQVLTHASGADTLGPGGADVVLAGLGRTVAALHALGRRVVFLGHAPSTGFDTGRCLERRRSGLAVLGVDPDCTLAESAHLARSAPVLALYARIPGELGIDVLRPDELCHDGACPAELDGVPLYRDGIHLSRAGSVAVADALHLADRIRTHAR